DKSTPVATTIDGIERQNENASAAGREKPAICPAAIVLIERDVPGKTADKIWHAPIQIAWNKFISSMCVTRTRVKVASTIHITTPPTSNAMLITHRLSRFLPITLVKAQDGSAVTMNATMVRPNGWVRKLRSPRSPFGNVLRNSRIRFQK